MQRVPHDICRVLGYNLRTTVHRDGLNTVCPRQTTGDILASVQKDYAA